MWMRRALYETLTIHRSIAVDGAPFRARWSNKMMKITKWEAQERYREIIDAVKTIMTVDDINDIKDEITALRRAGAWWHARLAERKLDDELKRRSRSMERAFNPDG